MKVKKYVGDTIQDTIFKVKADLGSDAIILNTRKYKKDGFLGLKMFGEKKVEVLAALEDNTGNGDSEKTLEEIDNLKNMISNLEKGWQKESSFSDKLPEDIALFYENLLSQGVRKEYCQNLIDELREGLKEGQELSTENIKEQLINIIAEPEPIEINNNKKIVAFIGPTGVGKTTTIAKLAAKFALEKDADVGMITADTYRIAAVQQLETYSEIMNIPLKVVYNEKELKETLNGKFGNHDLIFIDTAGSSWTDKMQLGRLKGFTTKNLVDETHLLVSLNTKREDIDNVMKHFSNLKPDKILLTKVDETSTYGDIINMRKKYELPYSYITFGQDVPDDITVAKEEKLLEFLIGDENE